jgi:NAD(P)-dependent dehydrogenase (short-subunit alcohol dehydrogenase family)
MRTPREDLLPPSDRLHLLPLDVTDPESIRKAVAAAGPVDVLVNNAGFGAASPAEVTPMTTVRGLFETNTLGTIAMTQAILPQFRQRKSGVVVNVTSSVTLRALPLIAAYRASKAAVNAFTESMALELAPFGVRARLVLPGRSPETRFGDNARSRMHGFDHEDYADLAKEVYARLRDTSSPTTHAQDVAEAVWRAATDPSSPMRIPAGADAEAWAAEAESHAR